ncbi:uncharacterized protein PSFLO_02219 [Pseudozyma flocculosa]|uniref:Uncharacterized protein n=1 Tax=Pseudozyma flocculosa TaxID=84751 RepID=A0A5C3EX02_9BASI|nr:uncharacterized protein PSFLO_02219 [Pseudozyma flocculosa]
MRLAFVWLFLVPVALGRLATGRHDKTAASVTGDKTTGDKTTGDKTTGDKTMSDKTTGDKTMGDKTTGDKTTGDRTTYDKTMGDKTTGDKTMGGKTMGDKTMGDKTMGDNTTGDKTMGDKTMGDKTTGSRRLLTWRGVKDPTVILLPMLWEHRRVDVVAPSLWSVRAVFMLFFASTFCRDDASGAAPVDGRGDAAVNAGPMGICRRWRSGVANAGDCFGSVVIVDGGFGADEEEAGQLADVAARRWTRREHAAAAALADGGVDDSDRKARERREADLVLAVEDSARGCQIGIRGVERRAAADAHAAEDVEREGRWRWMLFGGEERGMLAPEDAARRRRRQRGVRAAEQRLVAPDAPGGGVVVERRAGYEGEGAVRCAWSSRLRRHVDAVDVAIRQPTAAARLRSAPGRARGFDVASWHGQDEGLGPVALWVRETVPGRVEDRLIYFIASFSAARRNLDNIKTTTRWQDQDDDIKATTAGRQDQGDDIKATMAGRQDQGDNIKATTARRQDQDIKATTAGRQDQGDNIKAMMARRQDEGDDIKATTAGRQGEGDDIKATMARRKGEGDDIEATKAIRQGKGDDIKTTKARRQDQGDDIKTTTARRKVSTAGTRAAFQDDVVAAR